MNKNDKNEGIAWKSFQDELEKESFAITPILTGIKAFGGKVVAGLGASKAAGTAAWKGASNLGKWGKLKGAATAAFNTAKKTPALRTAAKGLAVGGAGAGVGFGLGRLGRKPAPPGGGYGRA